MSYTLKPSKIKDNLEIKGILKFILMDIENSKGKRAIICEPHDISYLDILKGNVFKNEHNSMNSVAVEDIDLDFPENLPLPRLPILKNENVDILI